MNANKDIYLEVQNKHELASDQTYHSNKSYNGVLKTASNIKNGVKSFHGLVLTFQHVLPRISMSSTRIVILMES